VQSLQGAHDTHSDLASVGNQDFIDFFGIHLFIQNKSTKVYKIAIIFGDF
jgi:hypothetical protein